MTISLPRLAHTQVQYFVSLRPTLSGFRLNCLTSLFECRDASLIEPLISAFNANVVESTRGGADEIIGSIILGGHEKFHPDAEDEIVQIVVQTMAHFNQEHLRSESLFWEKFLWLLSSGKVEPPEEVAPLILHLFDGRPFFGTRTSSSWSYYAYLTFDEARTVFDWIDGEASLCEESDFPRAAQWMAEVRQEELAVWLYAS